MPKSKKPSKRKRTKRKKKQSTLRANATPIAVLSLLIVGVFVGAFMIVGLSSFLLTPDDGVRSIPEYSCNVGDTISINITESTLPPGEDMAVNQSFMLTIHDLNYSSRPNEDGSIWYHGAMIFTNVIGRNGTGAIVENVTDWSGCYNVSNINLGFANVSYIMNSSFFVAPANFSAYVEVMSIFLEFGMGMNVTENSTSPTRNNITSWNGTLSGDGAGIHAQKWNIMFDATKGLADEIHVWNWTGSAWSSIVNGSAYYKSWI